MESPLFSPFREFLDMWDEMSVNEGNDEQIDALLDSGKYVFFFQKDKELYGAGEDGRLAFAKMKKPDDEMPKNWEKEASFSADHLEKIVRGEPSKYVFEKKDLKQIQVMDREKVAERLKKIAEKLERPISIPLDLDGMSYRHDPDQAPNFVQADED